MAAMAVERHYVSTGDRQLHYRRSGAGPPIVLLHGGLGASATLMPLLEKLAGSFTVIAIDLPGCGLSSALAAAEPSIADYASAVYEAIVALGIPHAHLYGKHTGAKVALALAVAHPEVVSHLTLDVLSLAPARDVSGRLAAYAPAIEPAWDGGHLLQLWHQVRNAGLFFPWYEQSAAARLQRDLAKPAWIHGQAVDVLCAEADYRLLFAANYGMDTRAVLPHLRVPATILVHEGDPTASDFGGENGLPPEVAIEVLPRAVSADEGAATAITRVRAIAAGTKVPLAPRAARASGVITRDYVATEHGRLHVRMAGAEHGAPLVMLHAGPGSTRGLEPLIAELSTSRSVIAFDTLGHGGSEAPSATETDIGLYADAVLAALEQLGLSQVDVLGTHTGALIALEMALRNPKRIGRLVLDGVPLFTPQERDDLLANYIPVLRPLDDGTHLIKLWHMLRDMTLFWPWYRHTTEGVRPFEPPDAEGLHRRMVDTIPALTTYHLAYAAAFRYPTRDRLPKLRHPTLMCAGPSDPLLTALDECGRLAPHGVAVVVRTPGGTNDRAALHRTAATYESFLSKVQV